MFYHLDIDNLFCCMFDRELDLNVFEVLSIGLITKASLDTDMNTKVGSSNGDRNYSQMSVLGCENIPAAS